MQLFEGTEIKHYIKDRLLLDIHHLQVHEGARIGLVGRNGSGKTTLLKMIAGEMKADEGMIIPYTSIELVPQLKRTNTRKSGGEVTQEYLQQAFNHHAGLLLLDEPTTNLDTGHIEWLEKKLKHIQSTLIIVSHDRAFLDQLCTEIWEIEAGKLVTYKGNYSDYREQKELKIAEQQAAYEKYEQEKRQLEEAIRQKEERAKRATKKPKNLSSSEARLKGAKPYFANKQKKLRKTVSAFESRLEQLEVVQKPKELPSIQMDMLNEHMIHNQVIVRANQVAGTVGNRLLWQASDFYIRNGEKVAIIGANGVGKTTLLKQMIHQVNGLTISPSIEIGYFAQNLTIVDDEKTIIENVQSSSKQSETLIRTVLARMHFTGDDVYKKVGVLSGGEKVKVSLTKIFLSEVNMLILDEPTNYLDIEALEALETLVEEYKGTIIFVSHDRMFTRKLATKIIEIHEQKMTIFDGTLNEYEEGKNRKAREKNEDERLLLETKISDVLSRLSIEPTEELEAEFQKLLREKKKMNE